MSHNGTPSTEAQRRIARRVGAAVAVLVALSVIVYLSATVDDWSKVQATVKDLGPLATFTAAVIAGLVALGTLRQKTVADARDQWWKRAQWAIDLTSDPNPRKAAIGHAAIRVLQDSSLAGDGEREIMRSVTSIPLDALSEPGDTDNTDFELEEG